jgi:hypothetical protein
MARVDQSNVETVHKWYRGEISVESRLAQEAGKVWLLLLQRKIVLPILEIKPGVRTVVASAASSNVACPRIDDLPENERKDFSWLRLDAVVSRVDIALSPGLLCGNEGGASHLGISQALRNWHAPGQESHAFHFDTRPQGENNTYTYGNRLPACRHGSPQQYNNLGMVNKGQKEILTCSVRVSIGARATNKRRMTQQFKGAAAD